MTIKITNDLTQIDYPRYERYKDSGVDWLGEIPEGWETTRLNYLLKNISIKSMPKEPLLSVTQDRGVIPRSWNESRVVMPNSALENFKYIRKGDFAISLRSFEGGIEYCHHDGIISPAYTVLRIAKPDLLAHYCQYLFKSAAFISEMQTSIVGIREGKNISYDILRHSIIPIPSKKNQNKIVEFLSNKSTQIDQAITLKQQQIAKLEEYKQIVIQNAVTKGLNPDAPMKDSGVDWIGDIPEHWVLKRLKYILSERNERSKNGEEPLFMVSQKHGLVVRSEYHEKAEVALSNIDNKIVYKNDLVFNKLKAHLGVFFKSNINYRGLVSPDYAVYKCKAYIDDVKFLETLFRNPEYIKQFIIRATGIVEGLIRLYTSELFDLHVAVPPPKEQKEILSYIEAQSSKIDTAVNIIQQEINRLKEYKTILINQTVTGKIKVS